MPCPPQLQTNQGLHRPSLVIGCLLLFATGDRGWAQPQGAAQPAPKPQWIWSNAEPEGDDKAWLRKGSRVGGEVETATLFGACDNAMEVFLNGELVATSGAPESERFAQ